MKKNVFLKSLACVALTASLFLAGCGSKSASKSSDGKSTKPEAHVHPTKGTHGGSLIELGEDEYHGEFLLDEKAETVTIYILDGTAKKSVPIDAKDLVINIKHDGKGEQFKILASPDKDDPAGKSSRFVLKNGELAHALHHDDADPKLVVTIAGKQYPGNIKHKHDDDGKTHKH